MIEVRSSNPQRQVRLDGPKRISPKVGKFNFIGDQGVFSDFDDSLWSRSTIYTLCVPLGSKVDAIVKEIILPDKCESVNKNHYY